MAQLASLLFQRNRLGNHFSHSKNHFLNNRFGSLLLNGELGFTRLRGWLHCHRPLEPDPDNAGEGRSRSRSSRLGFSNLGKQMSQP